MKKNYNNSTEEPTDGNNGGSRVLRRERYLRSRNTQELQRTKQQSSGRESIVRTDEALDVTVKFEGFTIGMNPESMSELLVLGIDSVDFTRELQQARIDFFSAATVSSATETAGEDLLSDEDFVDSDDSTNSRFTVVISYLVPIVVIGFAIGSLFYYKCYSKGRWVRMYGNHHHNVIERAQIGGMTATPMAASADSNSIAADSRDDENDSDRYFNFRRSSSAQFNSDDENEKTETQCSDERFSNENNKDEGKSTISKIITALNLNLTLTKSKNSTDEDDEDDGKEEEEDDDDLKFEKASLNGSRCSYGGPEKERHQQLGIPIICDPLVSPISGDSGNNAVVSADDQRFKAYANVLPPMIVIDNIDDSEIEVAPTSGKRLSESTRSCGTQIEELDAFASEFRKQLLRRSSNVTNPLHGSFPSSMHNPYASSFDNNARPQRGPNLRAKLEGENGVIVGMVSDDWDGDDLFSPIPSNITTEEDRRETRDDLLGPIESSNAHYNDVSSTSPNKTTAQMPMHKRMYGTWDAPSNQVASIPNLDLNLSSSSMPAAMNRGVRSDVSSQKDRGALPPKRPPTPERGSNKSASAFSLNPIARAMIGGTDTEGHRRKSSSETTSSDFRLTKNSSSISGLSVDDLAITSSRSDGSIQIPSSNTNGGIRLEFEAPREGNWGLVLESSSKTGPRVYAVKDYSPLFGLVQRGDKLLEIDGKNVAQSDLTDVTKILKGKSSYPYHRTTSTTMPIVISRWAGHPNDSSPGVAGSFQNRHHRHQYYSDYNRHRRNGSHGSHGSVGSIGSRVLSDVDEGKSIYYSEQKHNHQNHHQHHSRNSSIDFNSSSGEI